MEHRNITDKEFDHDRLGEAFTSAISAYDTERRVNVLVNTFLQHLDPTGLRALDVGCGYGHFSAALLGKGFDVTAVDIGPHLVNATRNRVGCRAQVADAMTLSQEMGCNSFDLVVSSECIEHTPNPSRVIGEMARTLKPGGWLSLSTPNVLWWPVVAAASKLRLRPFDALENFSTWRGLRKTFDENGIDVIKEYGLHLFPFQFGLHRLSKYIDQRAQFCRQLMINICLLGQKRKAAAFDANVGAAANSTTSG